MNTAQDFKIEGPIRRILVLRPRAMGDVLLMTPALRALRRGFSEAQIDVAVDDVLAGLLRRNPHIDRLWLFPLGPRRRPRQMWDLYHGLWQKRFDLVIDLHGSPRTAIATAITRARHRVGYALRGRGRLYNIQVPRDTDREGHPRRLYAAQMNLEVVARCGLAGPELENTDLVFEPDPEADERWAGEIAKLLPGSPRVGIAPAGTWQAKTAPPELFAKIADQLVQNGCNVLLLWGPGEHPVAENVLERMQTSACLAPETNLEELAALLSHLDVLVSNDSGVKHLAVARGTATVSLFGPTHPAAWMPPRGPHVAIQAPVPCLGCNFRSCLHQICMQLLDPTEIAKSTLELLRRNSRLGKV